MRPILSLLIGIVCTSAATAQSIPDPAGWKKYDVPRWMTTVQVGVQAGQVRPDNQTNSGYGYYPYYPVRPAGNRYSLSVHGFSGYRMRSWLTTGVSAGIDWYSQSQFFPVAAAVQATLPNRSRRVTPFVNAESGYAFRGINPHGKDLKGGWLWAPGIGIRINTGNHTGFIISAGYKHQRAKQKSPVDGVYNLSQMEYRRYNRVYFRMGFAF